MNLENKHRLIILSDLWGAEKSNWITYYTAILKNHYDIIYYDSRTLGEIPKMKYSEKELHALFIQGGIEKAVHNLLIKESKSTVVLGFSIGGYIAWKACESGLNTKRIIAVSSTRLRYETEKPAGEIELIYGEEDPYKPNKLWFEKLKLKPYCYKNFGHELYKNKEIAKEIGEMIMERNIE